MSKKIFDDGMLAIEKVETKKEPKMAARPMMMSATPNFMELNVANIIDTAYSYEISELAVLEPGEGQECAICGKKTSFANRYICPDCWKEHSKKILETLRNKFKNESIQIK